MAFCSGCGVEVTESWRYCPKCGKPAPGETRAETGNASVGAPMAPALATPTSNAERVAQSRADQAVPSRPPTCLSHPDRAAVSSCSICAEAFCVECLDEVGPGATCGACRPVSRTQGSRGPAWAGPGVKTEATKKANQAFWASIIGIFFCGPIVEVFALIQANQVIREVEASPVPIEGFDRAKKARVISIVVLVLWGLYVVSTALNSSVGGK